jgi:predicted amidohydrolase YtcJ
MEFERAFVQAGGITHGRTGSDRQRRHIAGFGDLREVELLVEAGFTPVEAIKIATLNGAKFLGEDARIGSIVPGKQADLMVVKGNPVQASATLRKSKLFLKMEWATTRRN